MTNTGAEGENIFVGGPVCCLAPAAWCRNTKYRITTKFIEVETGKFHEIFFSLTWVF